MRPSDPSLDIEIEDALTTSPTAPPKTSPVRGSRLAWILAAAATFGFAAIAMLYFTQKPPAPPPPMRLDIVTPSTQAPLEFALSPDGRYIVFVVSGGGSQRLWLRALDKTDPIELKGTDGADYPF
jgi:hypothetical protein